MDGKKRDLSSVQSNHAQLLLKENKALQKIKQEISNLSEQYGISDEQLFAIVQNNEIVIPVSIFNSTLSPLEAIVTFVKDTYDVSYSKLGKLLGRNERTIWITYNNAKKKHATLQVDEGCVVPIDIFKKEDLSITESLCIYLTQKANFSIPQIAKLLDKHPSALWTCYKRALKKGGSR